MVSERRRALPISNDLIEAKSKKVRSKALEWPFSELPRVVPTIPPHFDLGCPARSTERQCPPAKANKQRTRSRIRWHKEGSRGEGAGPRRAGSHHGTRYLVIRTPTPGDRSLSSEARRYLGVTIAEEGKQSSPDPICPVSIVFPSPDSTHVPRVRERWCVAPALTRQTPRETLRPQMTPYVPILSHKMKRVGTIPAFQARAPPLPCWLWLPATVSNGNEVCPSP